MRTVSLHVVYVPSWMTQSFLSLGFSQWLLSHTGGGRTTLAGGDGNLHYRRKVARWSMSRKMLFPHMVAK